MGKGLYKQLVSDLKEDLEFRKSEVAEDPDYSQKVKDAKVDELDTTLSSIDSLEANLNDR